MKNCVFVYRCWVWGRTGREGMLLAQLVGVKRFAGWRRNFRSTVTRRSWSFFLWTGQFAELHIVFLWMRVCFSLEENYKCRSASALLQDCLFGEEETVIVLTFYSLTFYIFWTWGQIYEVYSAPFQEHIWRILPRKRMDQTGARGLEPQYACDLGESSQDVLPSLMHMHLRVDHANNWRRY